MDYRVFLLDDEGHVSQVPQMVRCATDDEAARRARQLQQHQTVEVWQGARLVIKIAPPQ
jgi:phytoene/squalene synthetase